jgi:hypothetical protein
MTYCPICMLPLTKDECADCPAGEYPTHFACRVDLQEREEQCWLLDQEAEYRGREEDFLKDQDEGDK